MSQKKYTNVRKKDKNGGDKEVIGIVLVIVSAFLLLCIIIKPILGVISLAISNGVLAMLGYSSYPIFLCTLILGIAFIQDREIRLPKKYIAYIGFMAVALMIILQLATSHNLLSGEFGEYVSSVTKNFTAGGVLFGVVAYAIAKVITPIAAYIVFSLVFLGIAVLMFLPFFSGKFSFKRSALPAKRSSDEFVKGTGVAKTVKPVTNNSLFVDKIISTPTRVSKEDGDFNHAPQKIQSFNTDGNNPLLKSLSIRQEKPKDEEVKDKSKRSNAKQILYGDCDKYVADLSARSSSSSSLQTTKIDFSEEQNKYLSGYSLPPLSSAPDIRNTTQNSSTAYDEQPKKPTKKLHITDFPELKEIPIPPPKDISGQFVGGTIINGEEFARQYEQAEVNFVQDSNVVPESVSRTDNFNLRKIEPAATRPRTSESLPPEEPLAPIMNGDYFISNEYQNKKLRSEDSNKANPAFLAELDTTKRSSPIFGNVETPIKKNGAENSVESAEARFERLFGEEKARKKETDDKKSDNIFTDMFKAAEKKSDELIQPPLQSEIIRASDYNKRLTQENFAGMNIEDEIPKSTSAFQYDEEVEDLSEKSNFDGEDHTGYYTAVEDRRGMTPTPRSFGKSEVIAQPVATPILRTNNQLKIDDYVSGTPIENKPKKKKHMHYTPPPIDLLVINEPCIPEDFNTACEEKARLLEETLKGLKLPATVNAITRGPAVTRYELEMPPGIPIKRIEQFATDIEYYLASNGRIRIETPIPGKRAVGIEVPNEKIDIVGLRDIIGSKEFQGSTNPLTLALGKDIAGSNILCNLDKMPHLLIAGATGSGKSACLNSIIISILYKSSPEDVRLILIDPKHVEFTIYRGLPHLLTGEIITDAQQAINALKWARAEMERRYMLFGKHVVRNLQEYNKCDAVRDGLEPKIPFIVLVVDELAELMMSNNRKELEDKIMSMAQKARAAGIHLILATQRPSVDVITGTIKANLPSRIAFSVKSIVDSRTILDQCGAETLLGRGDMLYAPLGFDDPKRVQGAFVTNEEVATIASFVRDNNPADFDDDIKEAIVVKPELEDADGDDEEQDKEFDDIMPEVLKCIIESGTASTSMIQRRFSVGYARASRIIDQMELHKFIGPLEGSKPRAVYISREQYKELFGQDI